MGGVGREHWDGRGRQDGAPLDGGQLLTCGVLYCHQDWYTPVCVVRLFLMLLVSLPHYLCPLQDGFYLGLGRNGQRGLVPSNYVEKIRNLTEEGTSISTLIHWASFNGELVFCFI